MFYDFPHIRHINDVLPHIEGCDDFVVVDKGAYTVINYVVMSSDTFRPIRSDDPIGSLTSKIRRECRGIIFDNATGMIIRRPFHKFFNLNEREETIGVDLNQPHVILEKLDGSMIAPFITSDNIIRWGTKMGETEVAKPVIEFLRANTKYVSAALWMMEVGITPIFEWMSRDNQIVIDYGEPRLVLTAMRNLITGAYRNYEDLDIVRQIFDIEIVEQFRGTADSMEQLADHTRQIVNEEGYVVRFADGHMVKIKSDWYVAIHKAKENLLYERYVIDMIINNTIDDVKPYLTNNDLKRVDQYTDQFISWLSKTIIDVASRSWDLLNNGISRKEFALNHAETFGPFKSVIFRRFDESINHVYTTWLQIIQEDVRKTVLQNCISNSKLEQFKRSANFNTEW